MIIDEPQSVEGKQTKENLKQFNPMLTLRYSATHKSDSIYNMVYRLDAMEAYNKRLVKKIAVKGITESGTTATESYVYLEGINLSKSAPTATIQFDIKGASGVRKVTKTVNEGFNLYPNSGEMEEYDYSSEYNPNRSYRFRIDTFGNRIDDKMGNKRFDAGLMFGLNIEYHKFIFGAELQLGMIKVNDQLDNLLQSSGIEKFSPKNLASFFTVGYRF